MFVDGDLPVSVTHRFELRTDVRRRSAGPVTRLDQHDVSEL
jgi:hypothetical protein